ncbi:GtrA family protein [Sanguibacter antarcticus]|uniref:Putative flippase GtrA n=1 Tax=Sanguibacter antarcticus TaxID=372484 RepID=A0A2A9E0X4_9MICO|nr:GtrA family protein [Sanguibacter antarcticus]PFG32494.1 putative flippase GtrA [Sanguibacter antarcticus]
MATGAPTSNVDTLSGPPAQRPPRGRRHTQILEVLRFGSVGGLAFVVDTGMFNLLRFGPGDLLEDKPITAKILSVAIATLVSWVGNRYWTFSDRRTPTRVRELMGFAVVNIGGMAIAVACLGFSHYVLDLRSPLADNISANGVGLVLGTAFRYVAYRSWVFTADKAPSA